MIERLLSKIAFRSDPHRIAREMLQLRVSHALSMYAASLP